MATNVRLQFMPRRNDTAVISAMCLLGGVLLVATLCDDHVTFTQAPVANPAHINSAREFIDPNTASEASLARLPYIHKTRAALIAKFAKAHPPRAFTCAADLAKVAGIGRKTAWRIRRYLAIPYEKLASQLPEMSHEVKRWTGGKSKESGGSGKKWRKNKITNALQRKDR